MHSLPAPLSWRWVYSYHTFTLGRKIHSFPVVTMCSVRTARACHALLLERLGIVQGDELSLQKQIYEALLNCKGERYWINPVRKCFSVRPHNEWCAKAQQRCLWNLGKEPCGYRPNGLRLFRVAFLVNSPLSTFLCPPAAEQHLHLPRPLTLDSSPRFGLRPPIPPALSPRALCRAEAHSGSEHGAVPPRPNAGARSSSQPRSGPGDQPIDVYVSFLELICF